MKNAWQRLTIGLCVRTGSGPRRRTWQPRGAYVPRYAEATKVGPFQFYTWKPPVTRSAR